MYSFSKKTSKPIYFTEDIIEELAANMIKALKSEKRLAQLGEGALKMAQSHEIHKCKDQLLSVYERIARK